MRVLLLALILLLSPALAGGRAACRLTYGPPIWASCFAEQTILSLGPFELGLGLETRTYPTTATTLYTSLAWYASDWWIILQLGRTPGEWTYTIAGGVRW